MFEPVDASCITEAVKKVLSSKDELGYEVVSLFEVISIYQEIKKDREELRRKIQSRITEKLKSINDKYYVVMHDFEFEKLVFCISIVDSITKEEMEVHYCKDNGIISLYVTEGSIKHDFDHILSLINPEVEVWYDYCYKLKNVYIQHATCIKSEDASFLVNISQACICVYFDRNHITSSFKVLSFYNKDEVYCKCKFDSILELIKGQEIEFLKKIFIKISNCPEWMHEHLVMERHYQICEITRERKEEQKRQKKLYRKQKRREKLEKIFPFIKK